MIRSNSEENRAAILFWHAAGFEIEWRRTGKWVRSKINDGNLAGLRISLNEYRIKAAENSES